MTDDSQPQPQTEKKAFDPTKPFTEEEFAVEVADIDKFLDDQIHINLSSHGNLEPWLDIMQLAMRLLDNFGGVRPITIYVALLESGKKYDRFEGQDMTRNDCVLYMGMLLPYRLFTAEPYEDGTIDDYTLFKPNKDHRYAYFMVRVKELIREELTVAMSPVIFDRESFVKCMGEHDV